MNQQDKITLLIFHKINTSIAVSEIIMAGWQFMFMRRDTYFTGNTKIAIKGIKRTEICDESFTISLNSGFNSNV